ncbi:serine/threonine-protein kinase [Arthrobacter yangruifuii]|uniref:serine/threonine-protein kinase n=1 Tax=Arthrobacter yangruifuii TaxID=2606616 RepID=UPI001646E25D|nr:serine/threonine-protein kinase [Arthrobacter yangruifuii]
MIPDDYKLEQQIRNTQSAQVWLARDSSDAPIVLKLAANNSRVARRFKREIESMRAAAGAHVMPILDYDDSYSWYSMPVAVRTLHETSVPTSLEECLLVLEAITAALQPLHSRGQVHRDLKPENVLWLEDIYGARWVLADFGIVRNAIGFTTQQLTHVNGLTGSEGWAAPEQHHDAHESNTAADVYGAGAILSWMLTGTRPSFGHVVFPSQPRLKAVLRRATNPDPDNRYLTLDDFLEAFKDSTSTITTTLEALVEEEAWSRVGPHILGQPAQLARAVKVLPRLKQAEVHDWFMADRIGLISAISQACDDLSEDIRDLPYSDIDKFLSWGVIALRILVNAGQLSAAEPTATALFRATATIGQFQPAGTILDWLSTLNQPSQQAMETALHSALAWDFFQRQARGRWQSNNENDLMLRLREE